MVIDELIVRNGTTNLPIDSYDNQMIDEIVYEGNTYHFAKQKDLVGETSIIADNAVSEPIVSLKIEGNTIQNGTPNVEYPQEIESSGNNGLSATIRGKNLFDINNLHLTGDVIAQLSQVNRPVVENNVVYFNGAYGATDGAYIYIETGGADYLYFSAKTTFKEPQTNTYFRIRRFNEFDANGLMVNSSPLGATNIATYESVKQRADVRGYKYIGFAIWSNKRGVAGLYDIQIEKGDVATPYEPYFNNTIEIPPCVTLADGTEIKLGFEKLGNYANKLTIDRVNGKVTYLENCKTVVYDSSRYFELANVDGSAERQQFTTYVRGVLLEENNPVAKCSHLPYNRNSHGGSMVAFMCLSGAITQTMPRSVLLPFGFVAGTNSTYIPAFKAWLQDQKDKGIPFTVCAVVTPTEYDLTNTELGARLLEWAKTEKGTNIVEITSELPVSQTEMSYWRQIIPNE